MSSFDSPSIEKMLFKDLENNCEWKTIREIAIEVKKGIEVTKSQINKGDYPCIRYGDLYTKYDVWFDKCLVTVDPKLIKKPQYFEYGDILWEGVSQIEKDIGKCCAYLGNDRPLLGLGISAFKHNQNPKYLAYALSTKSAIEQKIRYSNKGSLTNLYYSGLGKVKIPLPPLDIQEKIVEVLDLLRTSKNFLIQKIEEEIENRDKQYEYYRDFILSLGGGVNLWFFFQNRSVFSLYFA